MLRRLLLALSLLALVPAFAPAQAADAAAAAPSDAAAIDAARTAAQTWLALLDAQDTKGSWEQAASAFKSAVPQETWAVKATFVRDPLGALRKREEQAAQYAHQMAGAPDGDYVNFQFQTAFEGKPKAQEKLTLMRDTDGQWRVAGYYVR